MLISMDDIKGRVLKNIDENEEILVVRMEDGYENASVEDLIRMLAPDVAERVVSEAGYKEIDEWLELPSDDVDWIEPGRGEMRLPSDFLRLMEFRMSDWRKSVRVAVSSDSDLYSLRFTPGRYRERIMKSPMVAVVGGVQRRRLEFIGSVEPGAYMERGGYLPLPYKESEDSLWIPRSLISRVIDAIAERVKTVIM